MGLFTRRKRDAVDEGVEAVAQDATENTDDPRPETPGRGPHDVADVPDLEGRLDLGALRVPARPGMQLRLEVEKRTNNIVAVTLGLTGSAMQLQVFAAPRTQGIWDELRAEITDSIGKQGGTVDQIDGPFGTELLARIPVRVAEGQISHRPARFVGVDGPRWFLRAVLTGKSAIEQEAAAELEEVLADVVVVRGVEARAPRDVLLLHAPGKPRAPQQPGAEPDLDITRRGPEITEVR
ncbi:DUF3710 domain-containing protein [Georgenia thermotolerans]|uniref:DUF3710 domain-containing protein n=1 Tax=Georgenia thermotolerans TaxID=527326 RepID=A0A7J5UP78_9MICO|nr:DUF3710 domain-containing protein [Georgenia thermotolerans]KAE8764205.1 DUF3710 domain-containing protein [Georgenia thermotolerans]